MPDPPLGPRAAGTPRRCGRGRAQRPRLRAPGAPAPPARPSIPPESRAAEGAAPRPRPAFHLKFPRNQTHYYILPPTLLEPLPRGPAAEAGAGARAVGARGGAARSAPSGAAARVGFSKCPEFSGDRAAWPGLCRGNEMRECALLVSPMHGANRPVSHAARPVLRSCRTAAACARNSFHPDAGGFLWLGAEGGVKVQQHKGPVSLRKRGSVGGGREGKPVQQTGQPGAPGPVYDDSQAPGMKFYQLCTRPPTSPVRVLHTVFEKEKKEENLYQR